jgi:hypothetical protein
MTPSSCGAWRRMVCACHFTLTIQGEREVLLFKVLQLPE